MCFVWTSEQTAIISLYNINWLVCITERKCVYCAVRTGSLNVIHVCFNFQTVPEPSVMLHTRTQLDQVHAAQIHCLSTKAKYLYNCLTRLTARGGAMAQAVSRWPLAVKARARSEDGPCEICGGQSGTGTCFSASTWLSPVSIIPSSLYTYLLVTEAL